MEDTVPKIPTNLTNPSIDEYPVKLSRRKSEPIQPAHRRASNQSSVMKSPKRRVCMEPPPRSNPTTPDTSLLLAHNANLTTREECIELCYRMDTFSDVTFRVGNSTIGAFKIYKLHRLVLGGQSSYLFHLCIKSTDPTEIIDLPDIQPYIFDHIVKWLYKAKLSDRTEDMAVIAKVYEVATELKVKELETKCLDTLKEILDREKEKEEKGEVSILDEMLIKPTQAAPQPQTPCNPVPQLQPQAPYDPAPQQLKRSNTEGSVSTHRRESKAREFFKGVMEKVTRDKEPGKDKDARSISSVSSSFLTRAKIGIRGGQRSSSHPIRTSMISHPFGAARVVTIPYPQDPGAIPSVPGLNSPAAGSPGSTRTGNGVSAYRNSTAF
ncbi:hypothetical protein TWF481_003146 [Arthrobotrys musiformis]|uniref:BTB domain-containing protein n=1 Tax=Arthrobotrys musiformis TaxID=47236 RepID=A0AAV9VQF3_9PEZI